MDVLKILTESGENLLPEDLEFFETELAIGNYDDKYVNQCMKIIQNLKSWKCSNKENIDLLKDNSSFEDIVIPLSQIAPELYNPAANSLTKKQWIEKDIKDLRLIGNKHKFKEYILNKKEIDEKYLNENFSFFEPWEMDVLISEKALSENFLEKYFTVLDKDKIARFQLFSEEFFMHHYADMNVNTVLRFGKNEWRKKNKRSKQLDVFLRLKGVKI